MSNQFPPSAKQSEKINELAEALALAQSECSHAFRDKANKFDNYSYSTLESFIDTVRGPMAKHGLSMIFTARANNEITERPSKKGGIQYGHTVRMAARLIHKSGQWIEVEAPGEGHDRSDKGVYKAMTGAKKYLVAALFSIYTSDDPETPPAAANEPEAPKPGPASSHVPAASVEAAAAGSGRPVTPKTEAQQKVLEALLSWTGEEQGTSEFLAASRRIRDAAGLPATGNLTIAQLRELWSFIESNRKNMTYDEFQKGTS